MKRRKLTGREIVAITAKANLRAILAEIDVKEKPIFTSYGDKMIFTAKCTSCGFEWTFVEPDYTDVDFEKKWKESLKCPAFVRRKWWRVILLREPQGKCDGYGKIIKRRVFYTTNWRPY
jgi:hypothetical protein